MWGISRANYLSSLGSQVRKVLFLSDMSFLLRFDPFLGSLWILSHIGKRCGPLMPYKLWGKGMVYHYNTHDVVVVDACPSWVTKPCGYHAMSDMTKPIPSLPQSGQYSWWALSLKSAFLCGGFPAQAICLLWGAKLARFCSQAAWVSFSGSTHFWKPLDFVPHRQEMRPTHAL